MSTKVWVAFGLVPLAAMSVNVELPDDAGVPLKTPVSALKLTPVGGAPLSVRRGCREAAGADKEESRLTRRESRGIVAEECGRDGGRGGAGVHRQYKRLGRRAGPVGRGEGQSVAARGPRCRGTAQDTGRRIEGDAARQRPRFRERNRRVAEAVDRESAGLLLGDAPWRWRLVKTGATDAGAEFTVRTKVWVAFVLVPSAAVIVNV